MEVVLGPGKYIREYNLLTQIGSYAQSFGNRAALIGGQTSLSKVEQTIVKSIKEAGMEHLATHLYGGESSWTQINRLVQLVEESRPDLLIGVGGGKALDTVKAVAYQTGLPLIVVPTIAATCAASTPISIIYDDQGMFIEISHCSKSPELVLVDTKIISEAPIRFLIAGIGDTLAKWFESKASSQKSEPTALNRSAVKLAEELYHLLIEKGPVALESIQQGEINQDVHDLIDGIIFISGCISGFGGDDCRTAGAHAIYSGLTIFPESHSTYHGEIVAFGILAQLVMEGKPSEEIQKLIAYYHQVQLPSTLAEMGITEPLTKEDWQRLGEVTVEIEDMANMPFPVTPQMVIDAIRGADQLGAELQLQGR